MVDAFGFPDSNRRSLGHLLWDKVHRRMDLDLDNPVRSDDRIFPGFRYAYPDFGSRRL